MNVARSAFIKFYVLIIVFGLCSFRAGKLSDTKVTVDTLNITSCDEYRSFWISWADGNINVGIGAIVGYSEFMFWQDPDPNAVAYLSISGWDNVADWEIIQFTGQKYLFLRV